MKLPSPFVHREQRAQLEKGEKTKAYRRRRGRRVAQVGDLSAEIAAATPLLLTRK